MFKTLLFSAVAAFSLGLSAQTTTNTLDSGKVKANNGYLTLLGKGVKAGQMAPDFKAADANFNPVSLSDFKNKAVLISVVPSLDTGICSIQTKHFNDTMAVQYPQVSMLTISMDLPFAQKRFCTSENINNIKTLSDAVWREFAANYGLFIEDMGLLARAVFVLDKNHKVVYKQLVSNLAKEPDYKAVEKALNEM